MVPKSLSSTLPRIAKAVRTKGSPFNINNGYPRTRQKHVSPIAGISRACFSSKSWIASPPPKSTTNSRALHSSISQSQPVVSSSLSPSSPFSPSPPTTATTDNNIPPPKGTTASSKPQAPLSTLSTWQILRNFVTSGITSSPTLLRPSLAIISFLANSSSPLLNPDRNPFLRFALKGTLYRQFCAGEDAVEVARTVSRLKRQGFSGIILGYAREVVLPDGGNLDGLMLGNDSKEERAKMIREEVTPWATGTMETLRLAGERDVLGIK